jgi:hypothetical protein
MSLARCAESLDRDNALAQLVPLLPQVSENFVHIHPGSVTIAPGHDANTGLGAVGNRKGPGWPSSPEHSQPDLPSTAMQCIWRM